MYMRTALNREMMPHGSSPFDRTHDLHAGAESGESSQLQDGKGKYRLTGFVSHMGANTACGHYVCHLNKDGRWAIFNDEKVAVSEKPPRELGYLYLFRREDTI